MSLLLPTYAPGANRVLAKPFCIAEIEVTINSLPDTSVAVNMPLAEMPVPVNEKSNVESANPFWVPASNKITTGIAARSLDNTHFEIPHLRRFPSEPILRADGRTRPYSFDSNPIPTDNHMDTKALGLP